MQRTWAVWPDTEQGVVSREAMISAFMDAEVLLARAGGVLTVVTQRERTGVPGEAVTTGALFQWKDRTDAKDQPEATQQVMPTVPEAEPEPEPARARGPQWIEPDLPDDDNPDGLDPATLEEEDVSAIPSHRR